MKRTVALVCLALLVTPLVAQQEAGERFQKVADQLVKAINAGDDAAIQKLFNEIMAKAFPPAKSKPFFSGLVAQFGKIERLEPPRLTQPPFALFLIHFERGKFDLKLVLDDQDKIAGLWVLPHKPPIPAPDRNKTPLALPFKGTWHVLWGGDTKDLNQHHGAANQKFAFDFLATDAEGKTHTGEGNSNQDYYAFGREILAPAGGVVTDVITGVRDNVPSSMNPYSALGNAVLIRHSKHEVSVLAHLKLGSIKVAVGDKVNKGQLLGLCGNSGNSSEPHLHYHLQNTPVIQDGTGIKCHFEKVTVARAGHKAESKKDCSPSKGDQVGNEK